MSAPPHLTLWYDEDQARGQSLEEYKSENIQLDDMCSWEEYEAFWQDRLQTDQAFCDLGFPQFSNIRMFRPGIRPTWEDPNNEKGGKWVIRIKEGGGTTSTQLWRRLLEQAFAGEDSLHDSGDVCGFCLLYTSPSPRDRTRSRMPSSA
eukprot:TRINITY_DN3274_c0_g1_i1.p1 TRINITY_DN3274_c0_g1~~TRINITY_DN3274_c0_g1_i1.p1  ORF type:complete len:148 (-),score=47.88 TRINITY_DN3274_c0_g1_i1:29-472(-)